jgi:arsenate reductase (thioredoxin)
MRKPKILFLCTGNSARSQMAEAYLRHWAGDRLEVYSAGLEPRGIHPLTVQVMAEAGIDLSGQRSKSVKEFMGQEHMDYLITVCRHAEENCPTTFLGFGHREHWDLEDPAAFEGTDAEQLAKFRAIRDQIASRLQTWLETVDIQLA